MNFDEVGRVWREEITGEFRRTRIEDLSTVLDRAAKLGEQVRRRDFRETVAAALVIPPFIYMAIKASTVFSALGAIIIVIGCVTIPIRLRKARRETPDPTLSVSAAIQAEVGRLRAQEKLLGSEAVWYVALLAIGFILMVAPSRLGFAFKVRFTIEYLMFLALIVWLNRRAARRKVQPLREELESWLADLRDSDLEGVS